MKNIDIFQILTEILALIRSEYTQRKTDEGPEMNRVIGPSKMVTDVVNLRMTVMTAGYTIICAGLHYLIKFEFAVVPSFLLKPGLEKTAAAATAIIVGSIGGHLNDVFGANDLSDDIAQILGDSLAIALSDNLAGILDGEFDLAFLIPVGIDLQASFANPFGVILVN